MTSADRDDVADPVASYFRQQGEAAAQLRRHELLRACQEMGTADLLACLDALIAVRVDPTEPFGQTDLGRLILSEEIAGAEAELARRRRLAEQGAPVRHPASQEAWRALAAAIREQADLVDCCRAWGVALVQTGKAEWHGPCPFCGGTDRFMVWAGRERYWCRRCDAHGDVITLFRNLTGAGFHAATSHLAGEFGLPAPDE